MIINGNNIESITSHILDQIVNIDIYQPLIIIKNEIKYDICKICLKFEIQNELKKHFEKRNKVLLGIKIIGSISLLVFIYNRLF